jgi:hypothetical protein
MLVDGINTELALSKASNNIGDINTRAGDFSNTITLELTANNRNIIQHSHRINSASNFPFQKNIAIIKESGITVFYGFAIMNAVESGIEVLLFSGNSEWFKLIKEKKLKDLDVSDLNHTFNKPTITANRLKQSVWLYPNIQHGAAIARPCEYWEFFPSMYVIEIMRRIFDEIDYEVLLPQIDSLNKSILINNEPIQTIETDPLAPIQIAEAGFDSLFYSLTILQSSAPTVPAVAGPLLIPGIVAPTYDYANSFFVNGGTDDFTSKELASYFILRHNKSPYQIALNCNITTTANTTIIALYIYTRSGQYVFNYDAFTSSSAGTYPLAVVFDSATLGNLLREDEEYIFCLEARMTNGTVSFSAGSSGTFTYYQYNSFSYKNNARLGSTMNMRFALPDITQRDFLIDIFNRYFLITTTDAIARKVTISRLDNLLANLANSYNWSEYFDRLQDVEVRYDTFDNYAFKNWFRNKFDEQYYIQTNKQEFEMDGFIQSVRDFENSETTTYESPLSPIGRVANQDLGYEYAFAPIREFSYEPKIGCVEITTDNLLQLTGEPTPTQSAEVFGDEHHFQTLLDNNAVVMKRIFQRPQVLRMPFKLTRNMYYTLQFDIPVYIDVETNNLGRVHGWFYINLIEEYMPGTNDSCIVELVRIK